ncbi:MAG: sugar ABC transporter permease [Anaerolineae bacterium]|nr:sugar ABC transporter permease [Anaerolineae bacterium]
MTDVLFAGEESLTDRSTRFAWTLLVPTVTILILVAARPLEQSFIKSLTDDQFGTSRPARFVGLRNYQDLLSFQFAVVPCQTAETGDCERTRTGEVRWERSALEVEQEQRLREGTADRSRPRYEAVFTIPLPGTNGLRLLATDPKFFESFTNTLVFSVISVTLELLIGLAIALVVNSRFRGRGLMRTAMLVPWAIPTVVSATLWQVIMRPDQTGILNRLLMDLGFISRAEPVQWLSSSGPWMASIIAVDVWKTAPFMALLLLAGLQTIPADIYEAAEVDGASKLRQFFSVTLPLLRPALAVALIFRTLDALRVFDVFQVLLDVRRPSMATYNYNILVNNQADGYASTVGVVIFVIIFIFSVMYVRVVGIGQRG